MKRIYKKLQIAVACAGLWGVVGFTPNIARADRGSGSIRASARSAPPPPPARAEPAHAEPARQEAPHGAPPPPEEHRDVHAAPPPRAVPQAPARRDWDDNDDDARQWGGYRQGEPVRIIRGQRIHDLPPRHHDFHFNNVDYFYDDDGDYYQPQPDGEYVSVQPPVGAIVAGLPDGAVPVAVGPTTYYYLDGMFYVAQGDTFQVVNPPPGIVVPTLPSDATTVVINGAVNYQFNGFNYQPSIQDGVTMYTVTPM